MASGRMLQKKICMSDQVWSLSNDTCRLGFALSIAHLNQYGCLHGDPRKLKAMIFPLHDEVTPQTMAGYIQEWIDQALVFPYSVNGGVYLFYPSFYENQPNLRPERERQSPIPLPPDKLLDDILTATCRHFDGSLTAEENRIEYKGIEYKGRGSDKKILEYRNKTKTKSEKEHGVEWCTGCDRPKIACKCEE